MRKYGGVNNQKSLYEIQEAHIVSAPGMSKITKKQSKASIFFGWIVYLVISYIITDLFIVIVTNGNSMTKLPLWAMLILPATPFLLTLLFKIIITKKRTGHKD